MSRHPFDRGDWPALTIVALLPIALALPAILGLIAADPLVYKAEVSLDITPGLLAGVPAIDPNNGYTTQALGRLAALEWLKGQVPWWNAFSGVGLPLAAEYQPAALSPLTLLQLLPNGMAWHQAVLQAIAGVGAFGLLRQLGLLRAAATTGALLFAFNGSLAWFAHGPATAIPWIAWMLWGVERAYVRTLEGAPGGWRLFAFALAMSLLAGFPETAYIGGLLALAWAVVRGASLAPSQRAALVLRIVPAGIVGLAVAAPQTISFFHYLAHAEIGDHADFSRAGYPWFGLAPTLIAPYFYGPVFGHGEWAPLDHLWGGLGGYTTAALLVVAAYGLASRPTALNLMLAAWFAFAMGKSFLVQPFLFLWNLVPGVTIAAFSRYVQPTWELALVILAANGIDAVARGVAPSRWARLGAVASLVAILGLGGLIAYRLWPVFPPGGVLRAWASASLGTASLVAAAAVALLWTGRARAMRWLGGLLVVEAVALYQLPVLSNPLDSRPDEQAIAFLRANSGMQRFYTLGPIQANYGAYLGIASINHNYLPVARRWTQFVRDRLDSAAHPIVFNGNYPRPPGSPSAIAELHRNLAAYEWVGVKYVVAYTAHVQPFAPGAAARQVHSGPFMTIYELPAPKPYFEVLHGRCEISARERTRLAVACPEPSTLLRRELFFPGWRATVNGDEVPIAEHRSLFQEIALPAGASEVRFDYAPPHIGWAWLAAALGVVTLTAGFVRRGGSTRGS